MRKMLLLTIAAATLGFAVAAQAHDTGAAGSYGGSYMMGPGYGGGYGPGYGMGPGMMYGYGPNGQPYRGGQAYRGKRLCWHQTNADKNTGYYGSCR